MLAFDRGDGKAETVRALGLANATALEAVVVHGAPPERVARVRRSLAALWGDRESTPARRK